MNFWGDTYAHTDASSDPDDMRCLDPSPVTRPVTRSVMPKFRVFLEVLVELDSPDDALNLMKNAVHSVPETYELVDSSVEPADEEDEQ